MSRSSIILSLLMMAATINVIGQGQEVDLRSVEQAIQMAWQQNPDLEVYQLQQQKATSEWRSTQSAYLPQVSATANGQWNAALATTPFPAELGVLLGEPGQSVEVQFGQAYNYNAGINLSQALFDWQAIQRTRLSDVTRQATEAQTDAFRQTLAEQVAASYYTALIAQEALAVSQGDLAIADSILVLAQDKFARGLIDQLSLNQALINLNTLTQNAASTQILLDQSSQQLSTLLNLDQEQPVIFSGKVELEDFELMPTLQQNQHLQMLQLQVRQADQQVKLQQSAHAPKLSFYSYLGKQQFRDDFGLSLSGDAWRNYSYLGINLSVPIFSGFGTRSQVKTAQIDRDIAMSTLEAETARSQSMDALLTKAYGQSLIAARAAYDNFQLSEENCQLSLQRFEQGVISLEAYFRVFDDYLKAENVYLNSLSALCTYYATIISRA